AAGGAARGSACSRASPAGRAAAAARARSAGPYICRMSAAQGGVGRLVVCPTPIGNLEDVTLRVLQALSAADVVACEDTRRTRKLLERHGLRASLLSFHEHNERQRVRALTERMHAGARVALVSDSGAPLVSDPGFSLGRRC